MFLNLFLFDQVVLPWDRKSVNKYLYLYLYLYARLRSDKFSRPALQGGGGGGFVILYYRFKGWVNRAIKVK